MYVHLFNYAFVQGTIVGMIVFYFVCLMRDTGVSRSGGEIKYLLAGQSDPMGNLFPNHNIDN